MFVHRKTRVYVLPTMAASGFGTPGCSNRQANQSLFVFSPLYLIHSVGVICYEFRQCDSDRSHPGSWSLQWFVFASVITEIGESLTIIPLLRAPFPSCSIRD